MTKDVIPRRPAIWARLRPAWLSRAEPRERLPVPRDPQRLAEALRHFAVAAAALADELDRG